tara:strand:+ start:283 stop:540 length:258 start_codon:yes stop_codon:yes gene_type:complete
MKTKKLVRYMKVRSNMEKQIWDLPNDYCEGLFELGIRNFFGVQLDDKGTLLCDLQEPYLKFLDWWKEKYEEFGKNFNDEIYDDGL